MKAFVYRKYGPPEVLELRDLPKPVPRAREILIRVRATTVSSVDWRLRSLSLPAGFGFMARLMFGFNGPRQPVLGSELAGEVESVGAEVRRFKPGDPVYGSTDASLGCHAQYRCMHEDGAVALKPAQLGFGEAAALSFGGCTALDFLRRARLRSGERVLVNGASGSVGTAAVQLARHLGARVTGVCSTGNLDLVRSLGAEQVIDYTRTDFAAQGASYDLIVDTAGTAPFARSKACLAPGGRLLLVLAGLTEMLRAPWDSLTSDKQVVAGPAGTRAEDVRRLGELAAAGHYRPVIDRRYPFEQMVEAHRYVDLGHKKGNVVVDVAGAQDSSSA